MEGRGIFGKFIATNARYLALVALISFGTFGTSEAKAAGTGDPDLDNACRRVLTADVVAFDMPLMWNRFGAQNINGMMYALRRDVVDKSSLQPIGSGGVAGNVTLRPDKRPRPLVLRMGAGDCLVYTVTNLLDPNRNPFPDGSGPGTATTPGQCTDDPTQPLAVRSGVPFNCNIDDQVADRRISLNFQGTELVKDISDDGSFVGDNASSLIPVGGSRTYFIRGPKEGSYVGTSYGATFGGEGLNGMMANGLWAVLNIQPVDSAFYRSQVTREEMDLSTIGTADTGHPIINYEARYGDGDPWASEAKGGLPIMNMVDTTLGSYDGEIVHSDINALIAYGPTLEMAAPGAGNVHEGKMGHFPNDTYPLESQGKRNPSVPNRLEPFREVTVAFHDEVTTKQAFPRWFEDPVLRHTLHGVRDSFMINYGSGGIGSEIIASRLRVGPPHDCINCAYEEFFLTAYTVADVGMVSDVPANFGLEDCVPSLASGCGATGPKATKVFFPDDPSNVHHSYVGEFVKMRNIHAGPGEQHVFHQHNHQWLFNPNDDNSNYLDAQGLGPGAGYSYEFVFGGAGNRNRTAGDAIFHCHFYPHFAQGMWEMWRIHDTFEVGTELQASAVSGIHTSFTVDGIGIGDGTPAPGSRALPDPEIVAGTPIPGVVPIPGKAMAPMPVDGVTVKANPNTLCVGDAPTYGLAAKNADGTCPVGYNERPKGSLANVPAAAKPGDPDFGKKTAGYPFWVAGIEHTVGQRPPTPPLDMITSAQAAALAADVTEGALWSHPGFADPASVQGWDGGLPRFSAGGFSEGSEAVVSLLDARLDLSKEITKLKPYFFPEEGTDLEKAAMAYHATREHPSPIAGQFVTNGATPSLAMGFFTLNGALPVPGAPYQEPCADDQGNLMLKASGPGKFYDGQFTMTTEGVSAYDAATPRVYKGANVQIDVVLNKLGYHYPQQRIIALWEDVVPSITKERPPEPLVMRMNTFDCTQYVHSNVVPNHFELDDYQVRTPTDIIGQHIHLPKWDLTTADGAANGWNYEDGTLSPGAVVEMIHAINNYTAAHPEEKDAVLRYAERTGKDGQPVIDSSGRNITAEGKLVESNHPFFGNTPYATEWIGARSTIQRWFADPVVNVNGVDRGLGIIFSHDHYGPSTHQQVGLYSTVLIEPAGSEWRHNETGEKMYTRADGGPTSWQAAILTGGDSSEFGKYNQNVGAGEVESHREFYFEYSDFQHAYQPGVYVGAGPEGFPLAKYQWAKGPEILPGLYLQSVRMADQGALAPDPETFRQAIQPSFRQQAQPTTEGTNTLAADNEFKDFPTDIWVFPDYCPGSTFGPNGEPINVIPRPCPEAISADDPGMYVVNYRNESLAARVYDPDRNDCPDESGTVDEHGGCQAKGEAGDLAYAMSSATQRKIPELNTAKGKAPAGYFAADNLCSNGIACPPINQLGKGGVEDLDPFTPMLRAYEGDRIHVKIQAGAHEEEHSVSIHGMKWLQAGSGFGEAKNSGWRNAQPAGISEQFSFRMPVIADQNQTGNVGDYAYNINSSLDGWVSGTWGIVRTIRNGGTKGNNTGGNSAALFGLPGNDGGKVQLPRGMNGVCPAGATPRSYDITAVLAEDVLPGIGIAFNDPYANSHAGRSPEGPGTLVYNSRRSTVAGTDEARGSNGLSVLHDPTAILYVMTDNLVADDPGGTGSGANFVPNDPRCWRLEKKAKLDPSLPTCPVHLKPGAPVEPVVIRANAGDCIEVTLRNKLLQQATTADEYAYPIVNDLGKPVFEDEGVQKHLDKGLNADTNGDGIGDYPVAHANVDFDSMPDLATGNATTGMVRRDANAKAGPGGARTGMTTFQTNLMAPSACVGLHPTLVEYDITRADGTVVGVNNPAQEIVCPNQTLSNSFQWYAGHIEPVLVGTSRKGDRMFEFRTTPIEFGGFNIMAADKLEQGQKGLVGAGVIYPAGATWTVDEGSNTAATVTLANGKTFRDFVTVAQKGASMFYEDLFPVENILGEGSFGVAEDAQDMGQMAINYGAEPLWYRFGVNPTDGAGFMLISNAGDAYSNSLVGGADPETAVFSVAAGTEFRQHVLMPFGPGRGSTYNLHGHSWQRDPYVCEGSSDLGLAGKCATGNGHAGTSGTGEVGSQALGINPIGMEIGGIESWFPSEHFEIFIPSAGGVNGVPGDYLFRDHMGLGNAQGLWGIIRVEGGE